MVADLAWVPSEPWFPSESWAVPSVVIPVDVLALLPRSHGVTARLTASVNGSGFSYPVTLIDGSVPVDASSAMRRTLTATVAAHIGSPECNVFETELLAEYGITGINGITTWIKVGTFVVTKADEAGRGAVAIRGEDRWRRVMNARFLTPVVTSGNTAAAIVSLVQGADSRITCTDMTGSPATHAPAFWERDRADAVLKLAESIGAQVVFDVDGSAQIRPVPRLTDPVAWRVYGGDGGVLIESKRGASQDRTYNAAVVRGESIDGVPPVRSVRTLGGTSAIRYGGPFASRPRYYTSPLITNQSQADLAADALLARVTGIARTVTLDTLPHPGLDGGDVLTVEVEPNVTELHITDSFTLPLGPGAVTIQTRTTVEETTE